MKLENAKDLLLYYARYHPIHLNYSTDNNRIVQEWIP
jgi:hypothetical protein